MIHQQVTIIFGAVFAASQAVSGALAPDITPHSDWRWEECPRFERSDLPYSVIRQLMSAGKCEGGRQNGENDRQPQEPGEDERQNGENDCRPQKPERPRPSKKDFGGHATAVEDYRNREGGFRGNDGGDD